MVCVPKSNGQLWVCINFLMVNKDIVKYAHPMHCIDEQFEAMSGVTVFTSLNMTRGYHQIIPTSIQSPSQLSLPSRAFSS